MPFWRATQMSIKDFGSLLNCTQIKSLAAFTVGFDSAQPTRDLWAEQIRSPIVDWDCLNFKFLFAW